MIPLFKVAMAPSVPEAVSEVLVSGFVGQGPKVEAFESALRQEIPDHRLVTVNSATSGLHLAIDLVARRGPLASPERGEILTTPLTCTATNWPILANGLRIRWVDVDPATFNLDLDDLARKVNERTAAIVVVHWAGYPVDLDRLRAIQDDAEDRFGHRPPVIEDCAHAWGATYKGRRVGGHGNLAVFSFQAIKHLTAGDGGLLVVPDDELFERAKRLRWFGIDREAPDDVRLRNDIPEWGYKFHMNDINATIGLENLREVGALVRRHQENAAYLDGALAEVPGLRLPERADDRESSAWIYSLCVERRQDFVAKLDSAGIMARPVHERNDRYSVTLPFREDLPQLDSFADEFISIPNGWWVTDEDRAHIVSTIKSGW